MRSNGKRGEGRADKDVVLFQIGVSGFDDKRKKT